MDTSTTATTASTASTAASSTVMDEFRAGVTGCLRSWSALKTAVEREWGGGESIQKADDLRANILNHMDGSRFPPREMQDEQDLEDALAIFMEEEFSIVLEDSSEKQVASVLWKMYQDCYNGDVRLARQVVQEAQTAAVAAAQSPVPMAQIQSNEFDDDDDDDEMEMAQDDGAKMAASTGEQAVPAPQAANPADSGSAVFVASDYAAESVFGKNKPISNRPDPPARQLGEAKPEEQTMELDDDGFAPVVKRKGKSRK